MVHGDVVSKKLMAWAAGTGQRAVIEDVAADVASPYRSIALTLRDLLINGESLNLADPGVQGMVAAWTSGGKATTAVKDALYAAGEMLISRADQIGLIVNQLTISQSLRGS
jgi:hypothetical protein